MTATTQSQFELNVDTTELDHWKLKIANLESDLRELDREKAAEVLGFANAEELQYDQTKQRLTARRDDLQRMLSETAKALRIDPVFHEHGALHRNRLGISAGEYSNEIRERELKKNDAERARLERVSCELKAKIDDVVDLLSQLRKPVVNDVESDVQRALAGEPFSESLAPKMEDVHKLQNQKRKVLVQAITHARKQLKKVSSEICNRHRDELQREHDRLVLNLKEAATVLRASLAELNDFRESSVVPGRKVEGLVIHVPMDAAHLLPDLGTKISRWFERNGFEL
jgi:hypothetical protein